MATSRKRRPPKIKSHRATKAPRSYAELQCEWYAKLRNIGFKDIEFFHTDGSCTNNMLQNSVASLISSYSVQAEYYFAKARWYCHNTKFNDGLDRMIWEAHTEGLMNPAIAARVGRPKEVVRLAVLRLKAVFLADRRYEQIEADEIAAQAARWRFRRLRE